MSEPEEVISNHSDAASEVDEANDEAHADQQVAETNEKRNF